MENSQNITFYTRSVSWLLNRNIFVEESTLNMLTGASTKHCENFLIILKDFPSLQVLLNAAKRTVSFAMLFPFSKLYFILLDENDTFIHSKMNEIMNFFYENSQFGYLYEVDSVTEKVKLRDLLTFKYVEGDRRNETNLIHPFVNRENDQKGFRISFYNCSPFIIYVDEENLR